MHRCQQVFVSKAPHCTSACTDVACGRTESAPRPARQQTQNGLARLWNYLSGFPPLLQHGFCQVRGNHLLPGDNGWPGRRGLEIGRANKIERKWQALSQNLQYLPACLQQVCHLNKHPSWYLLASVCVRACISTCCVYIHTCVSTVYMSACLYISYLTLIILKSGLFLSLADMLSMWWRWLRTFFPPLSLLPGALKPWQTDCFSLEEIFPVSCFVFFLFCLLFG